MSTQIGVPVDAAIVHTRAREIYVVSTSTCTCRNLANAGPQQHISSCSMMRGTGLLWVCLLAWQMCNVANGGITGEHAQVSHVLASTQSVDVSGFSSGLTLRTARQATPTKEAVTSSPRRGMPEDSSRRHQQCLLSHPLTCPRQEGFCRWVSHRTPWPRSQSQHTRLHSPTVNAKPCSSMEQTWRPSPRCTLATPKHRSRCLRKATRCNAKLGRASGETSPSCCLHHRQM